MELKLLEKSPAPTPNKFNKGLITAGLIGGVGVAISILSYPFISPAFRRVCLPFVPATNQQVSNVFKALEGRHGKLLDIGSGDGRIVLEAAKRGYHAYGVELNLWLVLYSRWTALKSGLRSSATFYRKDLWKVDFKPYENIVIFGVKEMMNELNLKFEKELQDTYVVACRFPIANKVPIKVIGSSIDTVWLYHFKSLRDKSIQN
ncbi:hypothetical protein O3M35_001915 [Rhynocoris fuscipes]